MGKVGGIIKKEEPIGPGHWLEVGSKEERRKGRKPGKLPALLPSIDVANHTPRITKHLKTLSAQHKIPTPQNFRKPPEATSPPDIWKAILLCVWMLAKGMRVIVLLCPPRFQGPPTKNSAGRQPRAKVLGEGGAKPPALIRSHTGIFSAAINSGPASGSVQAAWAEQGC